MGGYGHHELFERPERADRIWRYMDFAKLVDLLDRNALFFARADCMSDPWEGGLSPFIEDANVADLRRQAEAAAAVLSAESSGFVARSNEHLRADYRRHWQRLPARVFLSCWYLAEHESAAMWDLYAGREGRGVAIQSSFGRLEDALPVEWDHAIYAGKVRYIDYQHDVIPVGNAFTRFLHKRMSFEHERELRAMFDLHRDHAPERGFTVPVEIATLIERVHVAPTATTSFAALVERTVKRHGLGIPVTRSDLLTGPIA
jgi:hypothetical protein